MNSLSLRAVQAKKEKEEEVKSSPSSASSSEVEEPLEKRCSEEEIQVFRSVYFPIGLTLLIFFLCVVFSGVFTIMSIIISYNVVCLAN